MIKNCPMRHENGNCIPAGGFCTANKNICEALLNAYRIGKEQLSKESTTSDLISRQAAIDAICNACGKIDCDKMDKCEKLQLPPANCSEFPNNSDTISRQAAIDALDGIFDNVPMELTTEILRLRRELRGLPSADVAPVEILKAEIYKLKCQQDSKNQDYYTGYMSALSTVEGILAEMGEG